MSSFTISKKEYVKVAGYIAGIANSYNRGCRDFWVYDHKEHKNTDTALYYKRFVQCYEMNAESVKEQYHGDEVGASSNDTNEYKAEFNAYYQKGSALICASSEDRRHAVAEIRNFLHSSLYQTENEKYNFMMTHWYGLIIDQLTEKILLGSYEAESWGEFTPPTGENKYTSIIDGIIEKVGA